jgi:uncharacterized oxidoreductase
MHRGELTETAGPAVAPRRVGPGPLHAIARAILAAAGSEEREAGIVADHLVEANLRGHDSHGVGMLPTYVRNRQRGGTRANRRPVVERDDGPFLVVDGDRGFGHVIAREAIELGIARARQVGVAVLAIRNACHMGRIGTYGEQCAAAGLLSFHFVNGIGHEAWVAPHGGKEARLSTNPVCVAFPATGVNPAVVLDFATSRMSWGKIRVWRHHGWTLPDGVLLDRDGLPTTDPAVMETEPMGALLPFGEHKGSGLGLMCELLAGAVVGRTIQPDNPRDGVGINNMLAILLDPGRLGERGRLEREADALLAYVRGAPPVDPAEPVVVAGEPELAAKAERLARGVPIDDGTWRELTAAAAAVGVDLDRLGAG